MSEDKVAVPRTITPLDRVKAAVPKKSWRHYAVLVGVIVALVCKSLPPEYHAACEAVAKICTGGIL